MPVVNTDLVDHYIWGEQCDGWHLVKTDKLSIIQERMPAGTNESKHYHQYAEQFFYILSGIATMQLENETLVLNANEGIHIKASIAHQLSNLGSCDLHFMVTSTPPSHGDKVEVQLSLKLIPEHLLS